MVRYVFWNAGTLAGKDGGNAGTLAGKDGGNAGTLAGKDGGNAGTLASTLRLMNDVNNSKGWYTRGYLPHFDAGAVRTQFITFRLFDSLPQDVLDRIRQELEIRKPENTSRETFLLAERYLDKGIGECFLRRREVATIVKETLLKFDEERYRLKAWVIMPNHAHVMLRPNEGQKLEKITHSIKSFTASKANELLGRKGPFWMREAFDRYIRDGAHFASISVY